MCNLVQSRHIFSAFFGKAEQVCSGERCDHPTLLLMRLFHLSQVLSHLIVLSKVIGFIFWRRTNGQYFCFLGGCIWLLWYTPIDLAGCGVYCNTFEFFELSVGIWVHLFLCNHSFSVQFETLDVFWGLLKGCLFVFSGLWIWID